MASLARAVGSRGMADAARMTALASSAGWDTAGRRIDGGTAWLSVARGRSPRASGWRLQPARSSMSGWLSGKVDAFMNGERTLIGKDAAGNQFWEIPNPGGHPDPRREVSFPSPDLEDFDMNTVATEWRMWLYHARDLPPTEEEILRSQRERQAIYARALEIDKQDALQRQVELESKRLEVASGHGAQRDDAAVGGASTQADGEASGSGDTFKVGVFNPTKIDAS